jgi:predicted DNA-binding transcriptional regulator AlpA
MGKRNTHDRKKHVLIDSDRSRTGESDQMSNNALSQVYLTSSQSCDRFQITSVTLYRWEHDGRLNFPQPVKINRRKLYVWTEIEAWERQQAAASRRSAA